MPQAPSPQQPDSDVQDAYEAFKAYKAFKAQQSQLSPDAADKSAHNGAKVIPSPNPDQDGILAKLSSNYQANLATMRKNAVDPNFKPGAPVGDDLGAASLAIPISAAPAGIASLASYLGKSGIVPKAGRAIANAGIGAFNGARSNPDHPVAGATTGAVVATGLGAIGETLGDVAGLVGKAGAWAGGKLAGMSPQETSAYVRNPALAEEVYGNASKNPAQFMHDMYAKIKEAAGRIQEGYINPRLAAINTGGVGKSYQVNPGAFQGTEAGKVIQDSWNKQGNTVKMDVPTYEPYQVEMTPVETQTKLVNPRQQQSLFPPRDPYGGDRGESIPVTSLEVQNEIKKSGPTQVADNLLMPRGTQNVESPLPIPDSTKLTTPQLLRAKRASSGASNVSGTNPNNVSPADVAQAKKEGEAAVNLSKALHAQDPNAERLDNEISEALRHKQNALDESNPARLLTNNDTLGGLPSRSTQDFMDTNAGTNFKDQAEAYAAGKAMNAPNKIHGPITRAAVPVGRAAIKAAPSLFSADKSIKYATPFVSQGIQQSLFGNKGQ